MNTITFKRGKLGNARERVGHPHPSVDIKLDGRVIGYISPPTWQTKDHKWGLRFAVKATPTADNPADWRWFVVKDRFDNEVEGAYVMDHVQGILKLNPHPID